MLGPRQQAVIACAVATALLAAGCGGHAGGKTPSTTHSPRTTTLTKVFYRLHSKDTHGDRLEGALVPNGPSRGRALLVMMPGRGSGPGSQAFTGGSWTGPVRALTPAMAPVVLSLDSGASSYFHDRATGRWGSYVVDEVIPDAIKRFHIDPRRIGIGGNSMGGFGALDIARLHRGKFCVVGVREPAIWQSGGETAAGAFDSAADFDRHNLIAEARANPNMFGPTPIWIDHGDRDAFISGDDAFVTALRRGRTPLTVKVFPGTHFDHYGSRHGAEYLRFMTHELARCS